MELAQARDLPEDDCRERGTPELRFVRSCGGIQEYRLERNGLRMLYLPVHAAPVAVLMLTYDVGSRDEACGSRGASHMLEHMMFKGTHRHNRQQGSSISELLHPLGAQANATTWLDRTNYFNLVPASHLELAAGLEADRMRNLRIAPADLEAERTVVLNEYDRCADEPLEKLHQHVWRTAFASHAYGMPVLGSREDIHAFTTDRLREHYDRYYWPDNATVTVVGDAGREQALSVVARHFAQVPGRSRAPERPRGVEPAQQGERRVVVEQADEPGWVMLAWRSPPGLHRDTDALELLGKILAGGKLSRLHRPLVGTQLAAGAWPMISRLREPGLFQVQALLGGDQDHGQVEAVIREAVAGIARHGVTQAELDRAKGQVRGQLLTSRDGPLAIAMQVNEAIAAGDWSAYATATDRIDAVSRAQVQRVARLYLRSESLTVGHLVQAGSRAATGA